MKIDLSTATVANDGVRMPVYEGGLDLSTAYQANSTIGSRKGLFRDEAFQTIIQKPLSIAMSKGDELTATLADARRKTRLEKPDILGQVGRSLGRFVVGVGKSAVSIVGGLTEDRQRAAVLDKAERVKAKRADPNYVKWLDIERWSDNLALAHAESVKPVEVGGKVYEQRGMSDVMLENMNRFIENDLFVKPGEVNRWTDMITSGAASIGVSYPTFLFAGAIQAGVAAQMLAPAAIIGGISAGQAIEQGKAAGVDLDTRLRAGMLVGIEEGAIEALGFNFVLKYLKGGRPLMRIGADMVNNGLQEGLQGISSGAILKMEGISSQDWTEIFKDAAESMVVGFLVSGPASAFTYHAQNKSLVGDFRRAELNDDQMEKTLEAVMTAAPEDVSVKGDFAKLLVEKGFSADEAKRAEGVIEDYGGRIELAKAFRDSPVGSITRSLIERGIPAAVALEASEQLVARMKQSVEKTLAEDMARMQSEIAEQNAHTKIRLAFMDNWVAMGKPEGQTQEDWIDEGLALSDIVAMKVIGDAKVRGVDPVTLYTSESPEMVRAESAEEVGLYQGEKGSRPEDFATAAEWEASHGKRLMQSSISSLGFYSKLERVVNEKMSGPMPKEQLIKMLKNNGVKDEEIEWTLIDLPDKPTKKDVLDSIENNKVLVSEKVLGERTQEDKKRIEELKDLRRDIPDWNPEYARLSNEIYDLEQGKTSNFSQWQLPGGENYRERLFTLPVKREVPFDEFLAKYRARFPKSELTDEEVRKDIYLGSSATIPEHGVLTGKQAEGAFRSSHFDEPNIVVHTRESDRTDIEGKKGVFLEEVQSDWHQKGREQGYADSQKKEFWYSVINSRGGTAKVTQNKAEAEKYLSDNLGGNGRIIESEESKKHGNAIPNAPFKKTWHELALKKTIMDAVKRGNDRVYWTTGETQAERYKLSKQIRDVKWYENTAGRKQVQLNTLEDGRPLEMDVGTDGKVLSVSSNATTGWIGKHLEEVIGKGLAEKITSKEKGKIEGEGLNIGGEGMKGFYDQILPAYMKKFGKVGKTEIVTNTASDMAEADKTFSDLIGSKVGGKDVTKEVWYLDISPELAKKVEGGMPLFQAGKSVPRAMIKFSEEGKKSLIALFKTADKTSGIHELGHEWFRQLFAYVKSGKADQVTLGHYETVKNWLGITEDQSELTVEQQERFAKGLERVLAEGDLAYGSKVADAFMAFRDWVREVYKDVGLPGEELSPEVKEFFSWFLGVEPATADAVEAEMDSSIQSYDDIAYAEPEDFKESLEISDEDAEKVFEAEQERELLPKKKALVRRLKKNMPIEFFYNMGLSKDDMKIYEWMIKKSDFDKEVKIGSFGGVDTWLDDFVREFNEILGFTPDEEGRYSLDDFSQWIQANADLHSIQFMVKESKDVIRQGRDIEQSYATNKKIALKHLSKAMRKQKRLKAISNKVIAARKAGFRSGVVAGRSIGIDIAKERFKPVIDGLKAKAKDIKGFQSDITNLIKSLDLPAADKAKFISSIKRVDTIEKLESEVKKIRERASQYYDSRSKDKIQKKIDRLLDTTKPVKKGSRVVGKYDYSTNMLFDTYRRYMKMTQQEAALQLQSEEMLSEDDGRSNADRMLMRALQLRANGKKSSVQLYEAVLRDIGWSMYQGELSKNEEDFMKRLEHSEEIDAVLKSIDRMKGDKDSVKTKIVNLYRTGFTNIYSMLNSVMGRDMAEAYDPEILENEKETAIFYKSKEIATAAAAALGVDVKELNNVFDKMAADKITVSDIYDRVIELNRMDMIDIYLSIQNKMIKERYERVFGEETVMDIVSRLSDQEKALGDVLMEAVQEYYPVMNERNIEITGRDLGRVEGEYWPATSEKPVDLYDDMAQKSEIASAMKERGGKGAIPRPANAWHKAMKHVRAGEHIRHLSRRHEDLKRILTDLKVRNLIENKFGDEVYDHMMQQLGNISLHKEIQRTDAITGIFSKALNKWVVAKIALNPAVFVKQLISVGNYMEDMPVAEWTKYFFEGISDPKEAFDFMWKAAPFLEARFNRGYEEALARAMAGADNIGKMREDWAKALSALVRAGDITAIIFGGYPVIKYEMSNGKSLEEAVKIFEKRTIKAQQSGLSSGLAEFQNSMNPFSRLFFAFKNTAFQYTRKQVDAIISYSNGDISGEQLAKTITIYGIIQPSLYAAAGYAVSQTYLAIGKLLRGDPFDDEEEESLLSEILEQILSAPFFAVPVLNDLTRAAIRKISGKKVWKVFSTPILDEIESAFRSAQKKEITLEDWINIAGTVIEPATGAPVKTFERIREEIFAPKEEKKKTPVKVRRMKIKKRAIRLKRKRR